MKDRFNYKDLYEGPECLKGKDKEKVLREYAEKVCPDLIKDEKYDEKAIRDGYNEFVDHNYEFLKNSEVVDKPEFITREEQRQEEIRQGFKIGEFPTPLKDEIIIRMHKPEPSKIISVIYQPDKPFGLVLTDGEYKNKNVIFNLSRVKYRFNYDDCIHILLHTKDVLAVYE